MSANILLPTMVNQGPQGDLKAGWEYKWTLPLISGSKLVCMWPLFLQVFGKEVYILGYLPTTVAATGMSLCKYMVLMENPSEKHPRHSAKSSCDEV